ncbi:MAG: hypothetical protein LIO67_03340 [Lachnospiraceae bacterium]|nr:hypothetical protein [Lachnospiraceae bacterium]
MDETAFKAKVNELIAAYTKGKDVGKLRIVMKRKESGENPFKLKMKEVNG